MKPASASEENCNPSLSYSATETCSPNVAGQPNLLSSAAAVALNDLLKSPIDFVPASYLTVAVEMAVLRPRKAVHNVSTEHRRRRKEVCKPTRLLELKLMSVRLAELRRNGHPTLEQHALVLRIQATGAIAEL